MSETEKRSYSVVHHVASHLMHALGPACRRIEIAGSLRRRCSLIGDIEIVAIPRLHTNLLGDPMPTSEVDDLLATWPVNLYKDGPKYKAFTFEWQPGWSFKVDLFLQPDPATWGYNFLVRTGSAAFSKAMVTPKGFGGHKPPDIEIDQARVYRRGVLLDTPEEEDMFNLWGMDFVPPEKR